ncbi:MAG: hypothetical protein V1702_00505 [Candidatus Woesearchaeota archaeon]
MKIQNKKTDKNGLTIGKASLIFGILSTICSSFVAIIFWVERLHIIVNPYVGNALAIIMYTLPIFGVVFGIIGIALAVKYKQQHGKANLALALSIIGTAFSAIMLPLVLVVLLIITGYFG